MKAKLRNLASIALAAVALGIFATSPVRAEQVLVNFGNTPYTTDGVNTWQTFNPTSTTNTLGATETWVNNVGLVTTANVASGISLTVSGVVVKNLATGPFCVLGPNAGATQAVFDAPTSGTKPGWFNSTVAAQRAGTQFFDWDITYTFSGFSASDTVSFEFAVGGTTDSGDRALTLSQVGGSTLLNDVQTDGLAYYATVSGLTGSTSYSFLARSTGGTTSRAAINALAVTIPPVGSDTTPPTLVGTTPADEATGVVTSTNLVASFSEPVLAGTGNIELRRTTGGDALVEAFDVTTAPSAQLTFSGSTVTLNPTSNLQTGVEYYVLIPGTAVKDTANNFFAGTSAPPDASKWSFTTDGTAPTKSGMGPVADATVVLPGTDLTLTFDENVAKGSGNIVVRLASDNSAVQTIDVNDAAVTISGGAVTIDIADLAAGTQYYIEVDGGAFTDLSGNAYAGISGPAAWSFTTGTFVPIAIANHSAQDGVADPWVATTAQAGVHTAGVSDGDGWGFWVFGGALTQTLTDTYSAGATYLMTVDVVDRPGANTGWDFGLYYDDGGTLQPVVTTIGGPQNNGSFLEVSTDFITVDPADPWVGKNIVVTLNHRSASGISDWYDNVRLDGDKHTGAAASTFQLIITPAISPATGYDLTWASVPGMLYTVRSSEDLTGELSTWALVQGGIVATGDTTTLNVNPTAPRLFYRVAERLPLDEGFESDDGGFTVNVPTAGTAWTHGAPTSGSASAPNPGGFVDSGAGGSAQCWGINLGNPGYYADPTTASCLRSTVVDLTNVTSATLSFAQALDFPLGDTAVVRIIDAGTDTEIVAGPFPLTVTDDVGSSANWQNSGPHTLPVGGPIRIEWCFSGTGGTTNDYMGWYIDNVKVTPAP